MQGLNMACQTNYQNQSIGTDFTGQAPTAAPPPELVVVADRAQVLANDLRNTRDRLSALYSRISGGGMGGCEQKANPARTGSVGMISDALDSAFSMGVEIDTFISALERFA